MMKKTILVFPLLILSACTDPSGAERALKNTGLEPVKIGGYSLWGCSKDDWYKTKFTARRPDGEVVSGQVCAGMFFKGATVRFN